MLAMAIHATNQSVAYFLAGMEILRITLLDWTFQTHYFGPSPTQIAVVLEGHLNGRGYPGYNYQEPLCFAYLDKVLQTLALSELAYKPLHRAGPQCGGVRRAVKKGGTLGACLHQHPPLSQPIPAPNCALCTNPKAARGRFFLPK